MISRSCWSCAQRYAAAELAERVGGADIDPGVLVDLSTVEAAAVRALLVDDLGALDEALVVDEKAPPSPQLTFFVSWKLSAPRWPMPPSARPSTRRTDALRGVLDDEEVVRAASSRRRVHLAADAGVVNRHDRLGPRRDRGFDQLLVEAERVGPNVDEHGAAAAPDDGVRRRDERERRHDHLVARSDVGERERHLERRRARVGEERVPAAGPLD